MVAAIFSVCFSKWQKYMSELQLQNVDFSANGLKCEKTFQMKVLVKNTPEKTLQGSVMGEKWITFRLQC